MAGITNVISEQKPCEPSFRIVSFHRLPISSLFPLLHNLQTFTVTEPLFATLVSLFKDVMTFFNSVESGMKCSDVKVFVVEHLEVPIPA